MRKTGMRLSSKPIRSRQPGRAAKVIGLLAALLPLTATAGEIVVFAASSMKTVLDEIAVGFERGTGHRVVRSFAGSSTQARQIELGAPADVFISANVGWMDYLEEHGLIAAGTRRNVAANTLVLIAHGAGMAPVEIVPGFDLGGMLGTRPLAMAMVDAVPGGIYGKAALEYLGLWDALERRVVQTDNVRSALALVSLGESGMGIVYATDAAADPGVSIVGRFPAESHPPILYPAAATVIASDPLAGEFLNYLGSEAARVIFVRHGFIPVGE
jgi:molybdate transport system substrate-binding protein